MTALEPIIDALISTGKFLINCLIGWFVIERIKLFIKCAKTKHQWKQQQGRQ